MLDLEEVTQIEAQAYKCKACSAKLRVGQMAMVIKNRGANVPFALKVIYIHLTCLQAFLAEAQAATAEINLEDIAAGLRAMTAETI